MNNACSEILQCNANDNNETLIIDLDETLVHSYENLSFLDSYGLYTDPELFDKMHQTIETYSMVFEKTNNGKPTKIWGIFRPHIKTFLEYVFKRFSNVIIWSAGTEKYVEEIVEQLRARFNLPHVNIVWARGNCAFGDRKYHKPIQHLIKDFEEKGYGCKITIEKTYILDDKTYTFEENPDNGILIPAFSPGEIHYANGFAPNKSRVPTIAEILDRSDDYLLQLIQWFEKEEVKNAFDVRLLDKNNIFKNSSFNQIKPNTNSNQVTFAPNFFSIFASQK